MDYAASMAVEQQSHVPDSALPDPVVSLITAESIVAMLEVLDRSLHLSSPSVGRQRAVPLSSLWNEPEVLAFDADRNGDDDLGAYDAYRYGGFSIAALAPLFPTVSSSIAPDGTTNLLVAIYRLGHTTDDAYRNGGFGAVPASGEAIAALPKTVVGEGKTDECAVCMEGYETGQALRTMPCSHEFHEGCIFEWLRASRMCPLCRFKMPAKTEDGESDTEEDDDAEQDDVHDL